MSKTKLSQYSVGRYKSGPWLKRILWYVTSYLFFISYLPVCSSFKIKLLRLFGARIGTGITIKPNVNIKYPWYLHVGSNVWIGEGVWIDNLVDVKIGHNVCLSQGAYILTGSHDYKKSTFDLILGPIVIEDGVWIGAKSTVCPGITCSEHSVLAVGSVATTDLNKYGIYQGNPAVFKRKRLIEC